MSGELQINNPNKLYDFNGKCPVTNSAQGGDNFDDAELNNIDKKLWESIGDWYKAFDPTLQDSFVERFNKLFHADTEYWTHRDEKFEYRGETYSGGEINYALYGKLIRDSYAPLGIDLMFKKFMYNEIPSEKTIYWLLKGFYGPHDKMYNQDTILTKMAKDYHEFYVKMDKIINMPNQIVRHIPLVWSVRVLYYSGNKLPWKYWK